MIISKKKVILSTFNTEWNNQTVQEILSQQLLIDFRTQKKIVLENVTSETRLALNSWATLLIRAIQTLIFIIFVTDNSLIIAVVVQSVKMSIFLSLVQGFTLKMTATPLTGS